MAKNGLRRMFFERYGSTRAPIFIFSLVVLFWTIFDSIMTYVTPLLIEEQGFSKSMIGLIIGTSSITGAVFDFIICKILKRVDIRRIFLFMFVICALYPLLLWQAKTIWFFLFVMAVWGIYYDLYDFGTFDFIGRYTKKTLHASSFGMVQIFRALGGILGPFIVGFVIAQYVDWRSFTLGWLFLAISFLFFVVLVMHMRTHRPLNEEHSVPRRKNLFVELHLWKKLGMLMLPVLILTLYLFFIEAFFWTLAPLYADEAHLGQFGGLFLSAYTLPALFVGWFIGPLTKRLGKKRVAYIGLLIGSFFLSSFIAPLNPIVSIIVVFIASLFMSMSLPAINAAYADYITEAPLVEGEIEGLEDFAFNIGYIIGPFSAGFLADMLGINGAFGLLGLLGIILSIILLIVTPRSIVIRVKPSEL